MQKSKAVSYSMFIGSMLIFGTIGIFRRYIPLSSALLACTRGILGSLCILLFLSLKKKKPFQSIRKSNVIALALSGVVMGINWILLFDAYNYTSIATATLCYYMQPTIIILISPLLFKEKLTLRKSLCAAISLLGMVFISGIIGESATYPNNIKGIALGLGSALLYAAVVIFNKWLKNIDSYDRVVIQLSSAATVLIPYLLVTEDFSSYELNNVSIVMIIIVGIIHTGFAYVMYFASIKDLKAQSIAVLGYIDPVSAMILSALFLDEKMTSLGVIGAIMIIGATIYSEFETKGNPIV